MQPVTRAISIAALLCTAAALSVLFYLLLRKRPPPPSYLGVRGLKRRQMMEHNELFRATEPLIRFLGTWIGNLPLDAMRQRIARQLRLSGEQLGVTPNEFIAMSLLSGVAGLFLGWVLVSVSQLPGVLAVFVGALGLTVPDSKLKEAIRERFQQVEASLPAAIDLAALCMGAGLDFPGALRMVVDTARGGTDAALVEELQRILHELNLGHTRVHALEAFAERIPVPAVRDFVGAVVQAEKKGNPLADVLRIQATVLRMKRSMRLEEHAARAAVKLMGPLLLVFVTVLIILLGPAVLKMSSGGF